MGTFKGSFKLPNVANISPNIEVVVDNETQASSNISVSNFIKPAYKITSSFSKNYLWAGYDNQLNVEAKFYDGTPVSNTVFEYTISGQKKEFTTDSMGKKTIDTKTEFETNTQYWPKYISTTVLPKGVSDPSAVSYSTMILYGPNFKVDSISKYNSGLVNMTFTTYKIQLEKLTDNQMDNIASREPLPEQKLNFEVFKVTYPKTYTGDQYDPISKSLSKTYTSKRTTEKIKELSAVTDSKGQATIDFPSDPNQEFEIIVTGIDSKNRPLKETHYAYSSTQSQQGESPVYEIVLNQDKYLLLTVPAYQKIRKC